jgi:hypothetical protein
MPYPREINLRTASDRQLNKLAWKISNDRIDKIGSIIGAIGALGSVLIVVGAPIGIAYLAWDIRRTKRLHDEVLAALIEARRIQVDHNLRDNFVLSRTSGHYHIHPIVGTQTERLIAQYRQARANPLNLSFPNEFNFDVGHASAGPTPVVPADSDSESIDETRTLLPKSNSQESL